MSHLNQNYFGTDCGLNSFDPEKKRNNKRVNSKF